MSAPLGRSRRAMRRGMTLLETLYDETVEEEEFNMSP